MRIDSESLPIRRCSRFASSTTISPRRGEMVFLPLAGCLVQAGFPSPADDHLEGRIGLDAAFIQRPSFTFLVQAAGRSMSGGPADIRPGDFLAVDRSLEAQVGDVLVVVLNDEFTVKRLLRRNGILVLAPDNEDHPQIDPHRGNGGAGLGRGGGPLHAIHAALRRPRQ